MKNRFIVLKSACTAILCAGFVFGCKTDDSLPIDPAPSGEVISADTISDHLRFANAERIVGEIPKGPSGSSLQVSLMVGIDPTGIVEPHWGGAGPGNAEIIISPRGMDRQPIATATRPGKISGLIPTEVAFSYLLPNNERIDDRSRPTTP